MSKNMYNDVIYLDSEGHYGSAAGLVLIDVAALSPELRQELEQAMDRPNGVREFLFKTADEQRVKSRAYEVDGTGVIMTKKMIAAAESMPEE